MENNKWLILNDEGCRYITIASHWREALINYLEWVGIAQGEKRELFKKAFVGFEDYSVAIGFFNLMYYNNANSIRYMSPISTDCYCDLAVSSI